jgi:YesN/AraC family two-component response regulator
MEMELEEAGQLGSSGVAVKTRSRKPGIDDRRMVELVEKINVLICQDKIYREPELTLQDLSEKLRCPPYQVSVVINEKMKKNFYDLINGYRVEEAKRLLLDPKNKNYTILSVGFEAGFNSKTTFNTVFKKFTGVTPTDFRKQ